MKVTVNTRDIPFVPVTINLSAEETEQLTLWMESIKNNAAFTMQPVAKELYEALVESKWGGRKL